MGEQHSHPKLSDGPGGVREGQAESRSGWYWERAFRQSAGGRLLWIGRARLRPYFHRGLWSHPGGVKESGSVPLRPVWMLSGNNVSPYKDAYRRWVPCRLNTPLESPHERNDLTVANLRQFAREHRPQLLADALTILRAHALAGRPVNWTAPLGSLRNGIGSSGVQSGLRPGSIVS